MGIDRSTYHGPYILVNVKSEQIEQERFGCPNKKCRNYTYATSGNFCSSCGTKSAMVNFTQSYQRDLYEVFEDAKLRGERLMSIHPEWIDIKANERLIIPNVKFKHSKHHSSNHGDSLILDFKNLPDCDTAIEDFKEFFKVELKLVEENFSNLRYSYGFLIWYS
jgi:hypothetical protein